MAWLLNWQGTLASSQGDYGCALPKYDNALVIAREIGNKCLAAAELVHHGDLNRAIGLQTEALAVGKETGNTYFQAYGLVHLGASVLEHGEYLVPRCASWTARS